MVRLGFRNSGENSPVEVGSEHPMIYNGLKTDLRWLFAISEPSTVSGVMIFSLLTFPSGFFV